METQPFTQTAIGPLTIVVCIKQVPLVSAMRFDQQTRRLVREGIPLEINELDVYALTEAIRLRDLHGGKVVALTMGPPQARTALATALAMGADTAIHLNDRAFAGADTAATARTLADAIQHLFPISPDLIFCGRHSVDAETAQVGPELAEMLALPQVSALQQVALQMEHGQKIVIATRETDDGSETLRVPMPALLTAAERLNAGLWPNEHEIQAASQQAGERIQVLTAADLALDLSLIGQTGSPTWVANVEADTSARAGRIIAESNPALAIDLLLADLQERALLSASATKRSHAVIPTATPLRLGAPLTGKAVWVITEHAQNTLRPVSFELLGKGNALAAQIQGELVAVLLGGPQVADLAPTLAAYGAERVYIAADPALTHYTTEGYTAVLANAITRYQPAIVLFGSTANGRDLAPRIAARLKLGLTGDCIDLGLDEQQRLLQYKPAFGGSIISSILSHTTPAMATLRPGMLTAAQPDFSRHAPLEMLAIPDLGKHIHTHILAHTSQGTDSAQLESAATVLGVGMGMDGPEHYAPLYQLAQQLHAAIGATRNVADKGWLPKQAQIGLTGHAISPNLYIAFGIRGAPEHIAGIRKAGYIVSINKNKRAAIFKHSDLGIVGDAHVLLPLLVQKLAEVLL